MTLIEFIESYKGKNNRFGDLAANTPFDKLKGLIENEIIFYYEMNTSMVAGSKQAWKDLYSKYKKKYVL